MHMDQLLSCTTIGTRVIRNLAINGCNCIGFGEMGIANTSSAAMLMHYFTHIPLENCIGKGTGISEAQFEHKKKVLNQAKTLHGQMESMYEILCAVGGFELIQMAWGMLQAKTENMIILVDGFISTVAYVIAETIRPDIRENTFFCHVSGEQGHKVLLQHLGVQPLLNLHMRLGEGSACALAYPLIVSATLMLSEMASFQSAKVDQAL
jgi:nicotinate-nucleotide--dimethylbenzimidazole phosphoribosyltransferase